MHKLKAETRALTLTSSYQEITQTATKPNFRALQVVNGTGANITCSINPQNDPPNASEEFTLEDGNIFELASDDVLNIREDVVYMKGSGDIVIEMDFYQPL